MTTSGTLNFAAGDTTETFDVPICEDGLFEADETVSLTLSMPTGDSIQGAPAVAVLTITNEDTAPTISIDNVTVGEDGGNAIFTVTQSVVTGANTTFQYPLNGTATAPGDYTAATNALGTITAGSLTTTISIPINNDSIYESDETFSATLSNPNNATIATDTGTGTIQDNDPVPTISIGNLSVSEGGGNAVFTVTQSAVSAFNTTFQYSSVDGTAVAPGDYTSATNTPGTITAGNVTTIISIPIVDDSIYEGRRVL